MNVEYVVFERLAGDPRHGKVVAYGSDKNVGGVGIGPISPTTDGESLAIWVEAAIRQGDIEVTR